MKWYNKENILSIGVGVIGTIAMVITVVSTINLIGLGLDQVLGVENCFRGPNDVCKIDTNQIKREVVQSVSSLIVAAPTALLTFLHLRNRTSKTK